MRILIIEDEKLTAKDLARTIAGHDPDVEIVAMLSSVEESIAFFQTSPPIDLIFSDIQLGDGLSFEIFEKTQNQTPVIFCTAFNEYALEAFKTVGIDYLLKPFSKATVGKALEKFQLLKERLNPPKDEMKGLMNLLKAQLQPHKTPSVIIQQGDKIIPLDTAQVALFAVENDGVFAYTFDQRKWLLSQTLDHLEHSLSPAFFRANRQYLVNRRAVKDASQHFNRKIAINLTVPFTEQIVIGKLKVTAFVEWLANN